MIRAVGLLAIAVLLLMGCAQGSQAEVSFDQLQYVLSGGVAGFDRQLVLSPDGMFALVDRGKQVRTGQLSGPELQEAKRLLARLSWPALEPEYVDPQIADAIYETVRITEGARERAVRIGSGGQAPEQVTRLTAYLRKLYDSYKPRP